MFNEIFISQKRDVTGKFPEYPDEDEGGSALIFKNKSVTELENEMANMVCNLMLRIFFSKLE